ncbi:hypothetical protein TST_0744 [Thermosulfidibacter takaii ABI70S6]|uniref:Uncharacterized protein n=1 Tax=Thermosulfidibacter takaii (strain DSM 17441 / JCM 13301 / NBRC 103674 / ABI70S6) TaxID=1298851 RepID=A0A0S3QT96_THET7|nr:hypothetical protein TST_0744 [Thermosulfidibacter takaii ABI70S6]
MHLYKPHVGDIKIEARGGRRAASPRSGECVWVDRGMRSGELCSNSYLNIYFPHSLVGDVRTSISIGYGGVQFWEFSSHKLNQIANAIKDGKTFYLRVFRKSGCDFIVTKIGP